MKIHVKNLCGMPVVDSRVARQAGIVEDVLVDPIAGTLAALSVQHADGWLIQRVPAAYVYRLGPHAVLVSDTLGLGNEPPRVADSRWLTTSTLIGMEVLTDGGDRLGRIADLQMDDETLEITRIALHKQPGTNPFKKRYVVRPSEVLSCSNEMMVVRESGSRLTREYRQDDSARFITARQRRVA